MGCHGELQLQAVVGPSGRTEGHQWSLGAVEKLKHGM